MLFHVCVSFYLEHVCSICIHLLTLPSPFFHVPSAGLEEAIRDQKQKENILPQLMSGAPVDALFDREIKKYDGLKADVARNVTRNDELLAALTRDAQVRRG